MIIVERMMEKMMGEDSPKKDGDDDPGSSADVGLLLLSTSAMNGLSSSQRTLRSSSFSKNNIQNRKSLTIDRLLRLGSFRLSVRTPVCIGSTLVPIIPRACALPITPRRPIIRRILL